MSSRIFIVALVAVAALACAQQAFAQNFGGWYTGSSDNPVGPTVSPYINRLSGTGTAGVTNYQALVRPLIEQGNAINRQGAALNRIQQGAYPAAAGGATGHGSYFMNGMHFYPQGLR